MNLNIKPCNQCLACQCFGYCEKATLPRITDSMLSSQPWLRDARNFTSSLNIPAALWPNEIFNLWRDLKVVPPSNFPLEALFLPSESASGYEIQRFTEALRKWSRDFLAMDSLSEHTRVFITNNRREHARVVFSLVASHYPEAFEKWGVR